MDAPAVGTRSRRALCGLATDARCTTLARQEGVRLGSPVRSTCTVCVGHRSSRFTVGKGRTRRARRARMRPQNVKDSKLTLPARADTARASKSCGGCVPPRRRVLVHASCLVRTRGGGHRGLASARVAGDGSVSYTCVIRWSARAVSGGGDAAQRRARDRLAYRGRGGGNASRKQIPRAGRETGVILLVHCSCDE